MYVAYEDNKRSVVLSDGKKKDYFDVSMIPSDWYQWFDPDQPEDGSWTKVATHVGYRYNYSGYYPLAKF